MCFIKYTLLLLLIILVVLGCTQNISKQEHHFALRPGDLLFQDLDCGPLCDAIEKVTTGFGGANFSHVGIVAKDDDGNFVVIEAVRSGVEVTPLQTFLRRSTDAKGRPKVVVGRLKEPYRYLIPSALKEALALKGKPYDKVFAIDNDAYYCSELIYEMFLLANDNKPVFKLQPMTFKDSNTRKTLAVWQEYFSKLGVSIPEGQPGINPGGISRSPVLTIIHKYGTPDKRPLLQGK
ncbi:MAG: YiiX/YebB-like N1pC/P60 family cysteine hydrolase [Sedimentisphaerales bacterium]